MSTGKQKLYTFGCSYTYGHGFPDCELRPGEDTPSKFAWPHLLAEHLNLPYENLSSPGCSPMELSRRFLQNVDRFTDNDIVIIVWPFFDRSCMFMSDGYEAMAKMTPFMDTLDPGYGFPEMDVEYYYTHYTNEIHAMQIFMLHCMLVNNECKLRNIKVLHKLFCEHNNKDLRHARKYKNYDWFNVVIDRICLDIFTGDRKDKCQKIFNREFGDLPDGHRDSDHHILWAESIRKRLVRYKFIN